MKVEKEIDFEVWGWWFYWWEWQHEEWHKTNMKREVWI